MEYVFGVNENTHEETLKTKGVEHSNLSGYCEVIREYDDSTITDTFFIVDKYKSCEDAEGNCYDWYAIEKHNRTIDKSKQIHSELNDVAGILLELAADYEARICKLELGE